MEGRGMSWQRGWGEMTPGTDARPVSLGRMVTLSRGELDDLIERQKRKANRAMIFAYVIPAVLCVSVGMGASAAFGETIKIGRKFVSGKPAIPSTVTIAPSLELGQLAVVTFVNEHVNQEEDNGNRVIATPDVTVAVRYIFDFNPVTGADRIEVNPPTGVTCDPEDCGVTVMEGFTGRVVLFQWQGM
jgi:hypothetical protein